MFSNIAKWWLTGIVYFLPFQRRIIKELALWNNELSSIIGYLDEITIIVFLPLSIIRFYKNREFQDRIYLILLFPILVICMYGFISGMKNGNQFIITALGVMDYVKNFLVIFIYAIFFREFKDFKQIFHIVLIIAIFLSVVANIQELWAVSSRYIVGMDVSDIFYLLSENRNWRFGVYRSSSLMHHPNIFALYILLIFTIYIYKTKKINFLILFSLCIGILTSISKIAYTGLVFVVGLRIFKDKSWPAILFVILTGIIVFYSSFSPNINLIEQLHDEEFILNSNSDKVSFRSYSKNKALEIWKDHTYWGVGPGMFGGVVSERYNSFIYEEYNFNPKARTLIKDFRSIDQFWPQILGEMGIIGTISFAGFIIIFLMTLFVSREHAVLDEKRGIFAGLTVFLMVILIYTIGSGLNLTSVLFTYSAFAGIIFGCSNR
jgi:hypothetical protein